MSTSIDDTDKHILFEIERNARIPIVKLAKIVNKSKDAVKYRIKKLEESNIITGYQVWIDYAKLGYQSSALTFQLVTLPKRRKEFIDELKKDRRISWLGIAEGAWNLQVSFAYKNNQELYDIKNDLLSRYQDLIINTQITSIVAVYVHEKMFLINKTSNFIPFIDNISTIELDEISKKIIQELLLDARANIAHIAAKLNTTIDIIKNRINRLEESKFIVRYTTIIDYQKIGYDIYKAQIYMKSSTKEDINAIITYAENSDKIIHLAKQIAPWNIELIIFAKSFTEYHQFIEKFTERFNAQVQKIDTVIMSEDITLPSKKLIE